MRSFAQARARMKEFKLPDLGEGIHEGEVVRWLVNEGDPVKEEQLMVEVMTDKATVQIPSPWSGRVTKLLAKAGEVVKTGAGIILIEELGAPTVRKMARDLGVDRTKVKATGAFGRIRE